MSEITKESSYRDRKISIRKIAFTAIFTALASALMFLEIQLPFMPGFLKFDFSEIPVLIGSFSLGPMYGVIIELVKNLFHLQGSATMGIGELSNFLTGSLFVFSAGLFYEKHRTKKGAVISMIIGTIVLALVSCPLNYFVTIPLYGSVLGYSLEVILDLASAANKLVDSKETLILWTFLPFNLFKGISVSIISLLIYKPISKLISSTYRKTH